MFEALDDIARQAAAMAAATDGDLEHLDGAALGDAIVAFDAIIGHLQAARLTATRVHSRSNAWKRDGARSPVQWHRDHRKVSPGQAARDVDTAHALGALPRTAAGVAAGTVTASQAAVAARASRGLTENQTQDLDALTAEVAPDASDRGLRDAVTDFTHKLSADTVAERERQAHERRHLAIGRCQDGGWWIDGRLDVLGGELLAAALSSLSAPRGEDDTRTAEQRRADALCDLAERATRSGELPIEGGARPVVTVTADLDTLEARADCNGNAPAGRLDHSGAVSSATVRQLACDAGVHRVITDGKGSVLDVGRATRTVSIAQRRALAARDGGCVGCGVPPGWADAHHIEHWVDGGPTDLANLVLLCRSCHTGVHHRNHRLARDTDTGRWRVHRPHRGTPPPRTAHPAGEPSVDGCRAGPGDGAPTPPDIDDSGSVRQPVLV